MKQFFQYITMKMSGLLKSTGLCLMAGFMSGGMLFSSCDMLYTKSEEKLSGSEFWDGASATDVESFANSMYYYLRDANMVSAARILLGGDLRCAPIATQNNVSWGDSRLVPSMTNNDLNKLRSDFAGDNDFRADGIMRWGNMYKVVQAANILISQIGRTNVSDIERQQFVDEAVFMRCLTYFMLVRQFGDVPYYTNAYNEESLPRTPMNDVLLHISNDLQEVLDHNALPMTQSGNKKAVRASRGAVLALMMHINMWLACFDGNNSTAYYNKVVDCGKELVDNNGGAYSLVPISQMTGTVFKGASDEGIFELVQNVSYGTGGEMFRNECVFSNYVMYKPFTNKQRSEIYYTYDFMQKVYPSVEKDDRVTYWFDDEAYNSMMSEPREIRKFENVDTYNNVVTSDAGNQVIFRLADAILLYAEALADLGTNDSKACELLNKVRSRANASDVNASGTDLQDAIYWERVRELIGEGQYFYDLVRTKKICDTNYCWHTITRSQFNRGAWTWPISRSALNNNTKMELNAYWE